MYSIYPYPFMMNASPFMFSQMNFSGGYGGGGKVMGDSIQKGDWMGFFGGLGMLGQEVIPYIWQIQTTNNMMAMTSRLSSFQSLTFPQQWPTGVATG